MAEKSKNGPKISFFEPLTCDFFPFSGHCSPTSPGEAKIHFSALLPDFGPKARKQPVAGQRNRSGENSALGKYRTLPPK